MHLITCKNCTNLTTKESNLIEWEPLITNEADTEPKFTIWLIYELSTVSQQSVVNRSNPNDIEKCLQPEKDLIVQYQIVPLNMKTR